MPIIKSAIKRVKQAEVHRQRNLKVKRTLREAVKSFESAINTKDRKKADTALREIFSALDTAAKKNIIHKNKAARKKSSYNGIAKLAFGTSKPKTTATKTPAKKPAAKKPVAAKAKPEAKKPVSRAVKATKA